MSEILTEFLRSFKVLTSEEISLINEHTVLKSFKKGSILLKEGEVAKNCYAILKGCVRRYCRWRRKNNSILHRRRSCNFFY